MPQDYQESKSGSTPQEVTAERFAPEAIHEALQFIAKQCDGAKTQDGRGFNKFDFNFGHDLANRDELTLNQALAGKKLLRKYRGQLPDKLAEKIFGVADASAEPRDSGCDAENEPGGDATDPGGNRTETDYDNARRLIQHHGQDFRYCPETATWYEWTGGCWQKSIGGVERRAIETARSLYPEAAKITEDSARQHFLQHVRYSLSRKGIVNAIWVAQHQQEVSVRLDQLDSDPMLLTVVNGSLNLKTGELRPHRREDLTTKLAPVEYRADAKAPRFQKFLKRIHPKNSTRKFLQRVLGYAVTGAVFEKIVLILYGSGDNGKTTFLEIVRYVLGDYAGQILINTLMANRGEVSAAARSDLADLRGKRFVTSSEAEAGQELAEAQLKYLTGMGRIKAKRMRKDHFEFDPTHKLLIDANHKPVIRGTDDAIWNRILLLPFEVKIPKGEQDGQLLDRLKVEASGILRWLVEGCLAWQTEGLAPPEEIRSAVAAYRLKMDPVARFLSCCVQGPRSQVTKDGLHKYFLAWCDKSDEKPISKRSFGGKLRAKGFETFRGTGGTRYWKGIARYVNLFEFERR